MSGSHHNSSSRRSFFWFAAFRLRLHIWERVTDYRDRTRFIFHGDGTPLDVCVEVFVEQRPVGLDHGCLSLCIAHVVVWKSERANLCHGFSLKLIGCIGESVFVWHDLAVKPACWVL